MKLHYSKLVSITLLMLTITVLAEEPTQRFKFVIDRMVDAINKEDYPRIQKDFGKVMLNAFPLEKSKPFFKNLMTNCGKIKNLDSPQLNPPNQAIFPANFERAFLDIKLVLDNQDKIIGLWFFPHTPRIPTPEKHSTVLSLPFEGKWLVVWGGDTKELNQHHDVPNQKYAFDFLGVDSHTGTPCGHAMDE